MDFDDMTNQEKIRVAAVKRMFDYEEAKAKVPYWQAAGKAFCQKKFMMFGMHMLKVMVQTK